MDALATAQATAHTLLRTMVEQEIQAQYPLQTQLLIALGLATDPEKTTALQVIGDAMDAYRALDTQIAQAESLEALRAVWAAMLVAHPERSAWAKALG